MPTADAVRRLSDLFARRALVRPTDRTPNLVHLARAVASRAGVPDCDDQPVVRDLLVDVAPAPHLVFVLVDGLGMNLVRRLPVRTFLRRSLRRELTSIAPSTTAAALTSLATGQYPGLHAITGWHTYLPDRGVAATVLPFVDRATGRTLAERGLRAEDVLRRPSILPRMTAAPMTIVPAGLSGTTYNLYTRGGTPGAGYQTIPHAIDLVLDRVRSAPRPTYTHLYLPEVDALCHKVGVTAPEVADLVDRVDAELARLADGLTRTGGRLVVTADHGLIEVSPADQAVLTDGDPLLAHLAVPPTGDGRMPVFHLRPGASRGAFAAEFVDRFGDRTLLLDVDDAAERIELFGPAPMDAVARARFGDFVAVPTRPATLTYCPPHSQPVLHRGVHAGLSPDEMETPMCVS